MSSSDRALELSVEDLVGLAVHELRTPLGAMLMWIHALRDGSEADRTAAVDAIEAGVHEQGRIMSDLMDMVRARAGRLVTRSERVDLRTLLDALVSECAADAAAQRVTISLAVSPADPPAAVRGDPKLVRQTLEKVISRAVKRCRSGERVAISIRTTAEAVEVTVQEVSSPAAAQPPSVDGYGASPCSGWTFDLLVAHALVVSQGGSFSLEGGDGPPTASGVRLRWSRDRGAPPAE